LNDCIKLPGFHAVGGIYTVIKTKAPVTVAEYGRRYIMLGPLNHKSAPMEVESADPGTVSLDLRDALNAMQAHGIRYVFGRWLIEGAPYVLLFDLISANYKSSEWKEDLFKNHYIPSPPNDSETHDAIVFGYLVAWFLGEVTILFIDLF
jgi:glycogen(starch) synthase